MPETNTYWITVAIPFDSQDAADYAAETIASSEDGRVIDVQPEPPQGSTIVGGYSY